MMGPVGSVNAQASTIESVHCIVQSALAWVNSSFIVIFQISTSAQHSMK